MEKVIGISFLIFVKFSFKDYILCKKIITNLK